MDDIFWRIKESDVDVLKALLDSAPDQVALVRSLNEDQKSPLYFAVECNPPSLDVVLILLNAGADPAFEWVDPSHARIAAAHDLLEETLQNEPSVPDNPKEDVPLSPFAEFDRMLPGLVRQLTEYHRATQPTTRHLINAAVRSGDLAIVRLLVDRGVDLHLIDSGGYGAAFGAVSAPDENIALLDYLIEQGVDLNIESGYKESPILCAYRLNKFRLLRRLVEAGADLTALNWSPLERELAIGTPAGVEIELLAWVGTHGNTMENALRVAIRMKDERLVELMLKHGASVRVTEDKETPCLHLAVESGSRGIVEKILAAGADIHERDFMGDTALGTAAEYGYLEILLLLLHHGANPVDKDAIYAPLEKAQTRECVIALLDAGADPRHMSQDSLRAMAGLDYDEGKALHLVSREEYLRHRYEREGNCNPEDLTTPFRLAMIQCGRNAYFARKQFDDPPTFGCGISFRQRPPQVWCFDRFGQSATLLPDGRVVYIAGEHEDSYDPDFCIYNDVTVVHPDGQIQIFGYPYEVFEPTDFHTANLVGDFIWILGGLGYVHQRLGSLPVYKLDTRTYSISKVKTKGDLPPRLSRHRTELVDGNLVVTEGVDCSAEACGAVPGSGYELNLSTLVWKTIST